VVIKQKSTIDRALKTIELLHAATKGFTPPASVTIISKYGRDPFLVLISCLLSLRTKDSTSLPASCRLFALAKTPQEVLSTSAAVIESTIYPVGFYRQKTKQIHALCKLLINQFNGLVPNTQKDLLSLPGVGPKTANLVLSEGFEIPALCVDTHVHRISNRLGLVQTKTPEETEQALTKLLPPELWSEYTRLIVMWGQNVCVPISPHCSTCPLLPICPQVGVAKRR
jgi:endonuclease-3